MLERVDGELRDVARSLPRFELDSATLQTTRQMFAERAASVLPDADGSVGLRELLVPGYPGTPPVLVAVYEPRGPRRPRGVILDIHGGGFVFGAASMNDAQNRRIAAELDVIVVSVEYRLAPENPYPASLEDCVAALRWIRSCPELSAVAQRVIVLGNSAGGGLAASLSLWLRERGDCMPIAQILLSPMLDDRTCSRTISLPAAHVAWTAHNNRFGWESLLGSPPGKGAISALASPARALSLAGLPPTYLSVGSVDLFADESAEFARRLIADGVPTELHIYPGAFHGFVRFAPDAWLSRRCVADFIAAIERQLSI